MLDRVRQSAPVRAVSDRLEPLTARARTAVDELDALAVALTDERTPWHAKAVMGLTLGLAASPIDPIPDFVPVLGYVDDLLFIPVGVYLARRATPAVVLEEARNHEGRHYDGPLRWLVTAIVVVLWAVGIAVTAWWAWQLVGG